MSIKTRATIEDLHKVEGKAELVNGEVVCMSPTGRKPGRAGGKIYRRLYIMIRVNGHLLRSLAPLDYEDPLVLHGAR